MGQAQNVTVDSDDPEAVNIMTQPPLADAGEASIPTQAADSADAADTAWAQSLREIMRDVINSLPDHATLGELISATRANQAMAPVLKIFTVQELIDTAKRRPPPQPKQTRKVREPEPDKVRFDIDGNPVMDLDAGPKVIRRRADVPDGDLRVLRCLSSKGPQRESDLASQTELTAEQLRIILRQLRTRGHVHAEGTATKRRLKVTRAGNGYLRRHG